MNQKRSKVRIGRKRRKSSEVEKVEELDEIKKKQCQNKKVKVK